MYSVSPLPLDLLVHLHCMQLFSLLGPKASLTSIPSQVSISYPTQVRQNSPQNGFSKCSALKPLVPWPTLHFPKTHKHTRTFCNCTYLNFSPFVTSPSTELCLVRASDTWGSPCLRLHRGKLYLFLLKSAVSGDPHTTHLNISVIRPVCIQ